MIMAKEMAETIGERIVGLVKAIIRAMDYGTPHARTIWTMNVTRIDDQTFHVFEMDRPTGKPAIVFGADAAAHLIGHFALTSAFMVDQIPVLMEEIKLQAEKIGVGAGWLPNAKEFGRRAVAAISGPKVNVPSIDDRATRTLDQTDQEHLLRKLRKVEKASIEGTISRNALKNAIADLEERIEKAYRGEDYEAYYGAVGILEAIFGIKG